MKKTCWFLTMAAVVILMVMIAGRANSFGTTVNGTGSPGESAIKIDNFVFSPTTVTVPVGSTVRWTNHDDIPHNVVSEDKSFKSKVMDTDENFSYTFTKPGTYNYFCSIHPRMTGKIVVQ
jgi:plastocyanin